MAWSSEIQLDNRLINTFGNQNPKISHFYLRTTYQWERSGNTVNYYIRLYIDYLNDSGGTGSYGYPMGVRLDFNNDGGTGFWKVSDGISGMYSGNVGYDYFQRSITNTTGTGSVPIDVYGNNMSTWGFDNPGPHRLYLPIPAMDTYTISYNANGGSGAPGNQTKYHNTNLTLSYTQPTRADALTNGIVVTYNGNGGSLDRASDTSYVQTHYDFDHWNTEAANTGDNYNPGGIYTANKAATMYAQWTSSGSRQPITFPGGTRGGYSLIGFGTSSTSTTPVAVPYTPSTTTTLYAIWEEISKIVKIKSGTGWEVAPITNLKLGSNWKTLLDGVWTPQTAVLPSAYTELSYITCTGTQYINPNYTINANSELTLDFMAEADDYICILGNNAAAYDGGTRVFWVKADNAVYSGFGASRAADGYHNLYKNIRYKSVVNKTSSTINNTAISHAGGTTYYSILLFGDKANTSIIFNGRIYGATIKEGTTDIRNFVPCVRNSDSVVGMYDTVNNTFYTNAGTGTFGMGPKKTTWGNAGKNNTYSWFIAGGAEYQTKEDWTWRQWLDSSYNVDGWTTDEIDGTWYIIVEYSVGQVFCITNETASTEWQLLNKPIKNNFSYTIGTK